MKHNSILSSDPRSQKKPTSLFALILVQQIRSSLPPAAVAPPYDTEYFNYDDMHLPSANNLPTASASTIVSWLL
jgi:hypothetical protein